ncbi:MAG: ankyrin repeat domain-containing protein [Ignavibacteriota bacterium]
MSAQRIPTRRLPRRPNLEQLRKQAKELMSGWPGFTLSEAQRELARSYGFDSWPKLKAFVDGANVARLAEAVKTGDLSTVRKLIKARPELVGIDMAGDDEHRALHFAVLRRDPAMVRLLMQAGADARKGIFPHRDATSAIAFARDREYPEIVAIIEEEEQQRRQAMSCPNVAVTPVQDQVNEAIRDADNPTAINLLTADPALVRACDRNGGTPLHAAAQAGSEEMVAWLLARDADPHHPDSKGLTPLDRAALAADEHFPAVAQLLLAAGAPLTIRAAVAARRRRASAPSCRPDSGAAQPGHRLAAWRTPFRSPFATASGRWFACCSTSARTSMNARSSRNWRNPPRAPANRSGWQPPPDAATSLSCCSIGAPIPTPTRMPPVGPSTTPIAGTMRP